MIEQKIEYMVQKLPFYLKREVLDYIEFLSNKHHAKSRAKKKFKFDWEGGLSELKGEYTSVELQHSSLGWR